MTVIVAVDEVGRALARALAEAVPAGGAECVIGACAREDCDRFLAVASACAEASVPFFVVTLGPDAVRVSAVYGGEYGSCYECRAQSARAARGAFDHTAQVPAGYLPQHLRWAALAVADVIARLPGPDPFLSWHRTLDLFENTLTSTVSEDVHA